MTSLTKPPITYAQADKAAQLSDRLIANYQKAIQLQTELVIALYQEAFRQEHGPDALRDAWRTMLRANPRMFVPIKTQRAQLIKSVPHMPARLAEYYADQLMKGFNR